MTFTRTKTLKSLHFLGKEKYLRGKDEVNILPRCKWKKFQKDEMYCVSQGGVDGGRREYKGNKW